MDRKSIAIVLIASSFASSAFATNIFNKVIAKHSSATSSITNTHKTIEKTNHTYTDFSGTWVGDCGDGESESVVIENDASYISFDGDESRIGKGLQGRYQSDEEGTMNSHTSFEWNNDGSALIMKSVDVIKDNIDNSAMHTMLSGFTLTMQKGQINLDGKLTGFADLTQSTQPITIRCVFNKKQ